MNRNDVLSYYFTAHSVSELLKEKNGSKKLLDTLEYNFIEFTTTPLGREALEKVHRQLLDYSQTSPTPTDYDFFIKIAEWYKNSSPEQRKYPLASEDFYHKKTQAIIDAVQQHFPSNKPLGEKMREGKQKGRLLDIGCGDCQMCVRVAKYMNLKKTGVDLEGAADWGLESTPSEIRTMLEEKSIIYYNGKDLYAALREDTEDYSNLYDLVMFNHVLHHYPNFSAQLAGLEQTVRLIKPGGILFLSEHENILSDRELRLQHILFDLKTTVTQAVQLFPEDLQKQRNHIEEGLKNYVERKGEMDLYFSNPMLKNILTNLGLRVVSQTLKGEKDASRTIFTTVIKPVEAHELDRGRKRVLPRSLSENNLSHFLNKKPAESEPLTASDLQHTSSVKKIKPKFGSRNHPRSS